MEKRKPSHDLERFKAVCGDPQTLAIVDIALRTARELGFGANEIAALVRTMNSRMFYKSMTSYEDHRQWQDVYHLPAEAGLTIYMKFRDDIVTEFAILSFKER